MAIPLIVLCASACVGDTGEADVVADTNSEMATVSSAAEPAYVVFNYQIADREAYDPYLMQVPDTLEAYGAEIIIADFASEAIEGDAGEVTVVLRFASEEVARNWYQSPEYQAIIGLRTANSTGIASLASSAED